MSIFSAQSLSISHTRDGRKQTVLADVSFALEAGRLYDLIGPSGCGKSTLLRACAQLMPIDQGVLLFEDQPSSNFSPAQWRNCVALVPQKPSLIPGTVQSNLLLPWSLKIRSGQTAPSNSILRGYLDRIGLEDVELDRDIAQLSGGQAARVALVRTLVTNAPVLLIDEADAALDAATSQVVGELLQQEVQDKGRCCLRITHRTPDGRASATLRVTDGTLVIA